MATSKKLKTSDVKFCLKAIKDYVYLHEVVITEDEQEKIKAQASEAIETLPVFLNAEIENVSWKGCPTGVLPTI